MYPDSGYKTTHAQSVCTRPFSRGEGPGDEAILLCTCTRLVLSLCTREMLHICVKLEHAYIRNVNVRWTHRHTDRHDHRLTDHVGLAQARPNYSFSAGFYM